MKIFLCLGFVLFFSAIEFAENDPIIDSSRAKTTDSLHNTNDKINKRADEEDISYPPKPPETKISDIAKAAKGLKNEVHSLDTTIVNDVKREGLMTSVKKHRKFYFSIAIFVVLFLVWLRTRDKFR